MIDLKSVYKITKKGGVGKRRVARSYQRLMFKYLFGKMLAED
ncbi:hypothetical protein [Maribacter hydrothermalis]|nr:hypothetical protein [Maribacter hydrothermalis]